jgi:hypothetical protein
MKIFVFILLMFGFNARASECALSYKVFCESGGRKVPNMCPPKDHEKVLGKCLVNVKQKQDILTKCDQDKFSLCGDLENFTEIFLCLSYPAHWQHMDKSCLSSLTQGFH